MEGEIIHMVKNLYNGNFSIKLFSILTGDNKSCGIITSGGTESIMTAMLAYREWGRKKGIEEAEM